MAKTFQNSSRTSGKSLKEVALESGRTVNEVKSDVMKLAAAYKKGGMEQSEAMKKAYKEMGIASEKSSETSRKSSKKTTDDWKGAGKSLVSTFKKIGAAVGTYLAVDKIVSFGKSCVEAAATVSAQNAQFEATFKDLGGTAKEMFQNISNDTGVLATRLQTVGTGAFSQFKGAGLDAAEALKETGRYTNLAADAAAYYDMSLEEADSLMRSFIRGNTEAGDRLGLFTSETQRNEYALNKLGKKYLDCTEAEKQMIMLDIASNIYESSGAMGQASREADGYENVVGNLKEAWNQFMAVIGSPILGAVIPIVKSITSKLSEMKTTIENSGSVFDGFKTIISNFASKIQEAIPKVVSKAAEMMKQFGEKIKENLPEIVTKALDMIEGFADMIAQNLPTLIQAGIEMLKNIAQGIVDAIPVLIEKVPTIVSKFANLINDNAPTILAAGFDILVTLGKGLIDAIPTLIDNIPKIIQAIWDTFTAFNWLNLGKNLINGIKNGVKNAGEGLKNGVKNIFENIKNGISNISTATKNVASNIWNGLKNGVSNIASGLKNFVVGIWNGIKTMTSSIFGGVKSIASTIWNGIKGAISGVVNGIKSVVSGVWNGIKSTTSSVFNSIKSKASSVWEGIKSAITKPIESAKNAVKSAIDKIKSFFNFSWSLPPLKLPEIIITGKFGLNPPSVPHFDIVWHKKAMDTPMMFTQPTIFGMNPATGQMKGAGEAGDEVMIGKNTMLNMIQTAVSMEISNFGELLQKIVDILLDFFPQFADGQNIVLDDGTLVGRMSYGMDKELGDINRLKGRGA